ncbi:heat shock protein 90 [Firespike leaf roll-associated virus]|nr:heat shock protein 90 [Firespike leaf roll-associated virus]
MVFEIRETNELVVKIFRAFYAKSNVTEEIKDCLRMIVKEPKRFSGTKKAGKYSIYRDFDAFGGYVVCSKVDIDTARFLLWCWIDENDLLNQLFYPYASEIVDALCFEKDSLERRLELVDKELTEIDEFPYRFKYSEAVALCNKWGARNRNEYDTCFSVGNYLGREPTRDEVLGGVPLPKPAIVNSVGVVVDESAETTNERIFSKIATQEVVERADSVKSVRYKVWGDLINTLSRLVLRKDFYESFKGVPGVAKIFSSCLEDTETRPETFEERVEWVFNASLLARQRLSQFVPVESRVNIRDLYKEMKIGDGELIRGDWDCFSTKVPMVEKRNLLLSVGSEIPMNTFKEITFDLVCALSICNPGLNMTPTEAVLFLLLRFAHFNTNAVRLFDLPNFCEFSFKGKEVIVDFTGVSAVLSKHKGTIPNIERAWCAPFATTVFLILKGCGGSFVKWPDVLNTPAHMNFDFVPWVNTVVMSETERKMLMQLIERFRTRETPTRGFTVGLRQPNPADLCFERAVPAEVRGMVRELRRD